MLMPLAFVGEVPEGSCCTNDNGNHIMVETGSVIVTVKGVYFMFLLLLFLFWESSATAGSLTIV